MNECQNCGKDDHSLTQSAKCDDQLKYGANYKPPQRKKEYKPATVAGRVKGQK